MMRTDAVRRAGGYRDVHHMEDYDLFARALATGAHLHNLPEALTYFRVDDAQFDRRTGRDMLAAEARMQSNLVSYGMIGKPARPSTSWSAPPTGCCRGAHYVALIHVFSTAHTPTR